MTVDPERLKVAMDAAGRHMARLMGIIDTCSLSAREECLIEAAITALDAHDRQSKAPGDEAVARLATIARVSERYSDGLPSAQEFGRRIYVMATSPLVAAQDQYVPSQCVRFPEPCRTVSSCIKALKCLQQAEADYVSAPEPPPDTVPFTREMAKLLNGLAASVVYLLEANDASEDSLLIESGRRATFPPDKERK